MMSQSSTSPRMLNLWIPDIQLPTIRFYPIAKDPTCNSSQRRGARAWDQGTLQVNQLCSRKSWPEPLLSWTGPWSVLIGTREGYCERALCNIRLPLYIFKSLHKEKCFKNYSSDIRSAMFSNTHLPLKWSVPDTCAAFVFFRVCLLAFIQLIIIAIIFNEKPFVAIYTLVMIAKTQISNWL